MTRLIAVLSSAYERCSQSLDRAQSPLLLLIRLYWGWQFAQTGWGKLQHLSESRGSFRRTIYPLRI